MKIDFSYLDMKKVREDVAKRVSTGAKPAKENVIKFIDDTDNDPIATTAYVVSTIHNAVAYSVSKKYTEKNK